MGTKTMLLLNEGSLLLRATFILLQIQMFISFYIWYIHIYIYLVYLYIFIQTHLWMNKVILSFPDLATRWDIFIMAFLFRTVWNSLITSFYSSTTLKNKTSPSFVDWKNVRLASAVSGLADVMLLKHLKHLLAYLSCWVKCRGDSFYLQTEQKLAL